MKRGELVPDDVMMSIVEERLEKGSAEDAYMFDGFPRTAAQSELLDQSFKHRGVALLHVFFLDAPRAQLISRLTGRRICSDCGANYHIVNIPPKKEQVLPLHLPLRGKAQNEDRAPRLLILPPQNTLPSFAVSINTDSSPSFLCGVNPNAIQLRRNSRLLKR